MAMAAEPSVEKYKRLCEVFIHDIMSNKELKENFPWGLKRHEECMRYYLGFDKHARGIVVAATYYEAMNGNVTEREMHLGYLLGFCWDLLICWGTLLDDHVDDDDNRWGKLTWHKLNDKKKVVILDSIAVKEAGYLLLHKYFGDHPLYNKILFIYTNQIWEYMLACSFDQTHLVKSKEDADYLTMENYEIVMVYGLRVGFSGAYQLGMTLADVPRGSEFWKRVCSIAEDLQHFWEIQDDLVDGFGKDLENPVLDIDIRTRKMTWLVCKAKEIASPEQWETIIENFGYDDQKKVDIVKKVYMDLGIPEMCRQHVVELNEKIQGECAELIKEGKGVGHVLKRMQDEFLYNKEYAVLY